MVDAIEPSGGVQWDEVRARLLLDALPGVGPVTVVRLIETFGSAVSALSAPARHFDRVARVPAAARRGGEEARMEVDRALAVARRQGQGVVLMGEPGYPQRLTNLVDPPPILFLRGNAALLGGGGVAIVGSRRCTQRGRDVARRLAFALAARRVPVLSGLALGVDGAAHEGCLESGGETMAVLGRGADEAYPRAHGHIFRRILGTGLVVTEFAPRTPPLPHHFPRRNRILAALADSVVVVEAGERSGALITVEHALDLGIDVWAVPGPIDSPACRGSNALLADGARPLVSIDAFVHSVATEVADGAAERGPADAPAGVAGSLLRLVGEDAVEVDVLARSAEVEVPRALAALATLEVEGWVEQLPGMRFRRAC